MKRNRALVAAAVLAALLAAVVAAVVLGRSDGEGASSGVVPSVVGLDEEAAEERLVADGYSTQIVRRRHARPAGTVVAQQPQAGRRLEGGVVVLVVSSGGRGDSEGGAIETTAQEPVAVPKVTATHHILAGAALEERGLVADSFPVADDAECGTVLRQEPAAGVRLRPGGHVRLTVSLGREPRPDVQVPGLSGPAASARTAAREFGFTVRTVTRRSPNPQRVGQVLGQNPAALSRARELTQITLYVWR